MFKICRLGHSLMRERELTGATEFPWMHDGIYMSTSFFFYGTLKRGQANAHLVAPFIMSVEDATIDGLLYDLGEFPALIAGPGRVRGELVTVRRHWHSKILEVLDRLEGFDEADPGSSMYIRRTVVVDTDGEQTSAYAYFYNTDHPALLPVYELQYLEEGHWAGPSTTHDRPESRQLQEFRAHVRNFSASGKMEEGHAENRGCK